MIRFTNLKMVKTISIFTVFWICLCTLTLAIFLFFHLILLVIVSICSMILTSLTLLSKLTNLSHFFLPPDRAFLSLCGRCAAYFLEYSLSTLHSSKECPGWYNKHVFLHWLSACSKRLNFLSCSFQRGPSWGC